METSKIETTASAQPENVRVNPLIQNPDGSPKWKNPTAVMQRGDSVGIPYVTRDDMEAFIRAIASAPETRKCDTCGSEVWPTRWTHHKTWCNEENKRTIPAEKPTAVPQQEQFYQGGIWSDAHCNDFGQGEPEPPADADAAEALDQLNQANERNQ